VKSVTRTLTFDVHRVIIVPLFAIAVVVLTFSACTDYDFDQPDTPANREGFERHFGFPVPASVSDVYYFADELGADVVYQLGFVADQETIERIVSELELAQGEPAFDCIGLVPEFDWWKTDAVEGLTPYWKSNQDGDYYWFLWFEPGGQRAYYIEFSL
jgi:hypothetical protein